MYIEKYKRFKNKTNIKNRQTNWDGWNIRAWQ